MIEDDLSVFFTLDDFASACVRQRPGEADASFAAIWSHTDEDALDGHAISGAHRLTYEAAVVDLQAGDTITSSGVVYEVRRVDRVNDGREAVAMLREVPA